LGDAVAAAGTGARAVSVSLKDRAAILPLGRAGTPIWYDRKAVAWTSTAPVPWLAAHTAAHPIAPRLATPWTPLDAGRLAQLTGTTDDAAGEVGEKGFGPTFPHSLQATKQPAIAVFAAPLGNTLVLETGLAAIAGAGLGTDEVPDLLVVSLSAHDYAAHGWGHESWELWDMTLRLDDELARFLAGLDTRVGAGEWAMIVTSDHGGSPLAARLAGGQITHEQVAEAANRAASTQLGPGAWIAAAKFPTLYLSAAARAKPRELDKVVTKIVHALRALPGIARVERTADLAGHCERRTGEDRVICLALDPVASGEVVYLPKRGWSFVAAHDPVATSHGSLHDYDREVPVILLPPGRTPHPALTAPSGRLPMTRIAPLVAEWLGVPAPATLR
ncbi:MAG: alkaline phosphatase family protein, partial [Deltaproteobacteria bacterium]|nr:alkaline phosphatase family protein [Deltaproteobacteria bacterium]